MMGVVDSLGLRTQLDPRAAGSRAASAVSCILCSLIETEISDFPQSNTIFCIQLKTFHPEWSSFCILSYIDQLALTEHFVRKKKKVYKKRLLLKTVTFHFSYFIHSVLAEKVKLISILTVLLIH